MTIVEKLQRALEELESERTAEPAFSRTPAAREFSLAITAVEDAIMRTNRGFAHKLGHFAVADMQGEHDQELQP
jgi:hypothetical protein